MINQKEIAQRAGVSRATVSRAFTQNANVSPQTLSKIQSAMVSLGLKPVAWLPNEVKSKKRYVMVIAGDIANYFFSEVIKGICDQLNSLGILSVVCNSNYDPQLEEEQIAIADKNNYLGIIFITAVERPTLSDMLRQIKTPMVFVNRYLHSTETNTVCIDNYMGGYMAASHLIQNRHTRVAYIANFEQSTPQQDRIHGFFDAVKELHPANFESKIFYGDSSVERGRQMALQLVGQGMPYTAIFVADCLIAVGLTNALHDCGYRIPADLSILCFDDSPYINESGLCLSTVKYDPYAMGKTTVNTLMQNLSSGQDEKFHVVLSPQLVTRRSVRKLNL